MSMTDDKSPLVRDILISDAVICHNNEDSLLHNNFIDADSEFF